MIYQLLTLSFTVYIITVVITGAHVLSYMRQLARVYLPFLTWDGVHFIDCRLCIGLWAAIAVCWGDWRLILPVYGISYFITMQERRL